MPCFECGRDSVIEIAVVSGGTFKVPLCEKHYEAYMQSCKLDALDKERMDDESAYNDDD